MIDVLELLITVKDAATAPLKKVQSQLKGVSDMLNKNTGASMGFGLGMIFGGMAIKRYADTAWRAMWKVYTDIIDVHNAFFQKTQELSAAWMFFKFSLIDALSQSSLFMSLVDWLIQLVDGFNRLSPPTKTFIGLMVLLGIIVGSVMMFFGQMFMLIYAFSKGAVFLFTPIAAIWGALQTFATWLLKSLGLLGLVGLNSVIALIFAFFALIGVFLLLKSKYGSDWWKAWLAGIALAIGFVVQFVVSGIKTLIDFAVAGILRLIEAYNFVAGKLGLPKINPSALEKFINTKWDIMPTIAGALDSIGLNPKTKAEQEQISNTKETNDALKELNRQVADLKSLQQDSNNTSIDHLQTTEDLLSWAKANNIPVIIPSSGR